MKKKNKLMILATLSTACLLSLASCQGAQGPKGDQGEPGINGTNGTNGKNGEDGADGNGVRTGKGVPTSSLGKDGDSYIDTDSFDFYVKADGQWKKEGNIKGASGDTGKEGEEGAKGEDGTSIRNGKGVPNDTLGNDGDCYIDLSTFDFYVKSEGKWSKEGSIKGEKGEQGEKGDKGTPGSNGSNGAAGKPGATAWGNTILPSTGGYVTVDKGSATTDQKVTFKVYPQGSNLVTGFTLGDTSYIEKLLSNKVDDHYEFTIDMQTYGFVVKTDFTDPTTNILYNKSNGKLGNKLSDVLDKGNANIVVLNSSSDFVDEKFETTAITNKSFTFDLNGKTLTSKYQLSLGEGVESFKIIDSSEAGNGVYNFTPDSAASKGALNIKIGGDSYTNLPDIVIEKGVTVSTSAQYGVVVDNSVSNDSSTNEENSKKAVKVDLKVKGKVTTSYTNGVALFVRSLQKDAKNATSNIKIDVSGTVEATNGTAIDMAAGNLYVNNANAVITGKTGLYAKKYINDITLNVDLVKGNFTGTDTIDGYAIYTGKEVTSNISEDVLTKVNGRLSFAKIIVSTAEELKKALTSLIVSDIELKNDISLSLEENLILNTSKCNSLKTINANGKKLTIDLKGHEITNDVNFVHDLVLYNGSFEINDSTYTNTQQKIDLAVSSVDANVSIKNVKLSCGYQVRHGLIYNGEYQAVKSSSRTLYFKNVFVYSSTAFAILPNENEEITDCGTITFEDSTIYAIGASQNNNTALFVASPFKVNLKNSKILGDRHCIVVRNGDVTVTNSKLYYTGTYSGTDVTDEWGEGREVPAAAFVVGNKIVESKNKDKTEYIKYYGDAKLTFVDDGDGENTIFDYSGQEAQSDKIPAEKKSIYIVNDGVNNTKVVMTAAVAKVLQASAYVGSAVLDSEKTIEVYIGEDKQTITDNKWKAPQD